MTIVNMLIINITINIICEATRALPRLNLPLPLPLPCGAVWGARPLVRLAWVRKGAAQVARRGGCGDWRFVSSPVVFRPCAVNPASPPTSLSSPTRSSLLLPVSLLNRRKGWRILSATCPGRRSCRRCRDARCASLP